MGISTDNNIPVEIVPASANVQRATIASPQSAAIQEVIMQRQPDNTIKFVVAQSELYRGDCIQGLQV